MSDSANNRVVLVMGKPSSGKTASLMKLAGDPSVAYINTDLKDLPFRIPKKGLNVAKISDPKVAKVTMEAIEANHPKVKTVILDTITFLMDQYETQYVNKAVDTRAAWGGYGQFYKEIMHIIKSSKKNWIVLAHASDVFNEKEHAIETKVPVKGAVGKTGVEADFTIVVATKKVSIEDLEPYTKKNSMLNISDRERELEFKYVFQTYLTGDTMHEKIRAPMDMWAASELFIDNDISHLITKLKQYHS